MYLLFVVQEEGSHARKFSSLEEAKSFLKMQLRIRNTILQLPFTILIKTHILVLAITVSMENLSKAGIMRIKTPLGFFPTRVVSIFDS